MPGQSRPTLLLTRPEPASRRFAGQARAALGADLPVVIAPLMATRFLEPELPAAVSDGAPVRLVLTSETGVAAFCRLSARRDMPVWCVGPRSAEAARQAGFADVLDGGGDAAILARQIAAEGADGPPLIHVRGRDVAGSLAQILGAAGIRLAEIIAYAQDAQPLDDAARSLLAGPAPVLLPLFSPRSARLLSEATGGGPTAPLLVAAISPAVADAASVLRPAALAVATSPDAEGILDALSTLIEAPGAADARAALPSPGRRGTMARNLEGDVSSEDKPSPDESPGRDAAEAGRATRRKRTAKARTPADEPPGSVAAEQSAAEQAAPEAPAPETAPPAGAGMAAGSAVAPPLALGEPLQGPAQEREPVAADDASPPDDEAGADPTDGSRPAASAPPPPASPEPRTAPRSGGGIGLVLGGVVAAGLGFALAQVVPEGWPFGAGADRVATLESRLADQARMIESLSTRPSPDAALAERLAAVESALEDRAGSPAPSDELAARIAGLEADMLRQIELLSGRLDALADRAADPAGSQDADERLAAVEADLRRLVADLAARVEAAAVDAAAAREAAAAALTPEALDDFRSAFADLTARVEAGLDTGVAEQLAALREAAEAERAAAEARAAELEAQAGAAARVAMGQAAVLRAQAAIDSGEALEPALADLSAAGIEIPPSLADAVAGVPTLSQLQASFPAAARAAIAASAQPSGDSLGERFASFLRAQTNVRSLTPRAGSDPDAILSRTEAALRAGNLTLALDEADSLPEPALSAMAGWRAEARARAEAQSALAEIAAGLNGN